METDIKKDSVENKIKTDYDSLPTSPYDYIICDPLVNEYFEVIDEENAKVITESINREEMKTLEIYVRTKEMIPTAVMFCIRDHKFTRKIIRLNQAIEGWEILYSFFLTGNTYRVWLYKE